MTTKQALSLAALYSICRDCARAPLHKDHQPTQDAAEVLAAEIRLSLNAEQFAHLIQTADRMPYMESKWSK